MSDNWGAFLQSEFDFFSLSPFDVAVCIIIGLLCVPLIRLSGPRVLGMDYHTRVVQYTFDDVGLANIVYRIISPVVTTYIMLIALSLGSIAIGQQWSLAIRWMPVLIYWITQALIVSIRTGEIYPIWTVFIQALVSLMTAIYFDWVVVCKLPVSGITAFDQSNIGWQVLTGIFLAASQFVLSGIISGVNRYNSRLQRKYYQRVYPNVSAEKSLDQRTERILYKYIREYDDMLPERFSSDLLLRAFFFTVMLIEDSNRPNWFRAVERVAFRFGIVKTTGIMQVRSKKALSDEESVAASLPIIENIWNDFLIDASHQACYKTSPAISFSSSWYRYRYEELRRMALRKCGLLYGKYCGTVSIDIRETFGEVLRFFDCAERFFSPEYVEVKSALFSRIAEVMPGRELFFCNGSLSILPEVVPASGTKVVVSTSASVSPETIKRCVATIEDYGFVISASSVSGIAGCTVTALVDRAKAKGLSERLPDWKIAIVDVAKG